MEALREEVVGAKSALNENRQLRGLVKLKDSGAIPSGYDPVTARVITRSPTIWFADVTIDVGSGDGVAVGDPVVNGDGKGGALVGEVTEVDGGSSKVRLIADGASSVSAKVVPLGSQGVVSAKVGDPSRLNLEFINSTRAAAQGPGRGHRRLAGERHRSARSRPTSRSAKSSKPRSSRRRPSSRSKSNRSPTCATSTSSRS